MGHGKRGSLTEKSGNIASHLTALLLELET